MRRRIKVLIKVLILPRVKIIIIIFILEEDIQLAVKILVLLLKVLFSLIDEGILCDVMWFIS